MKKTVRSLGEGCKIAQRIKRAANFAAANRRLDERKAVDSHFG
jgi:hypothetical protein